MRELLFLIAIVISTLAVVSCGSEKSTNVDSGFLLVSEKVPLSALGSSKVLYYEKYAYEIDHEKSVIVTYAPVCREQGDSLYWSLKGEKCIGTFNYNTRSKKIIFDYGKDSYSFVYEGNVFPYGDWKEQEDSAGVSQGFTVEREGIFMRSTFFTGECAISNLKKVGFLDSFFDGEKFSAENCEEAQSERGFLVTVNRLQQDFIELKVSKDEKSCLISLSPRYAVDKVDCQAAYAEYKERPRSEAFSFDDYNLDISGDEECFVDLMESL